MTHVTPPPGSQPPTQGGYPADPSGVQGTPGGTPPPPNHPPPPSHSPPPSSPPVYGHFAHLPPPPQRSPGLAGAPAKSGIRQVIGTVADRASRWAGDQARRLMTPQEAVMRGKSVITVMAEYPGLLPTAIRPLEVIAADGPKARQRVADVLLNFQPAIAQSAIDTVAQIAYHEFGIRDPRNAARLRWNVAQDLVRDRQTPPGRAMEICGLPEAARRDLEEVALNGPARAAVRQGHPVMNVAAFHGLAYDQGYVTRLAGYAAAHLWEHRAQEYARQRWPAPPIQAVAQECNVDPALLLTALAHLAIDRQEPIGSVMQRFQLPPDARRHLEAYSVQKGPLAEQARTQRVRVADLARQYDISDPFGSGLERAALRGLVGEDVRRDLQTGIGILEVCGRYGVSAAAIEATHGIPLSSISVNQMFPPRPPDERERTNAELAQILLDGKAAEELRDGATVSVVAAKYDIDEATVDAYAKRMAYR